MSKKSSGNKKKGAPQKKESTSYAKSIAERWKKLGVRRLTGEKAGSQKETVAQSASRSGREKALRKESLKTVYSNGSKK